MKAVASHRTPSASRWQGALSAQRVWSAPACRRFELESGGEPPHSKRFALARRTVGAARLECAGLPALCCERIASPVQVKSIYRFKIDRVKVEDDF